MVQSNEKFIRLKFILYITAGMRFAVAHPNSSLRSRLRMPVKRCMELT